MGAPLRRIRSEVAQGQVWPHTLVTSLTQRPSQDAWQQNGSTAQIWPSHTPQDASIGVPVTHASWQTHAPQSCAQAPHVSPQSHVPSPHAGHAPQSWEHVEHDSVQSHTASPHTGHAPQSWAHVEHDSVQSHIASPHTGHAPQSCAQLPHVSPASQSPLPQATGHCWPQTLATSLTQMESQDAWQQNGSTAQIWASHPPQDSSSAAPITHTS
jgi:hypothetical protein